MVLAARPAFALVVGGVALLTAALIEGWRFDAAVFGVPAQTLGAADPAHWLALETVASALTEAGFPDGARLPKDRTAVLLGNSLGVGYWLYQAPTSRLLTGITPVAEVHVRTPLNHRTPADFVFFQDQVNITSGAHFRFNRAVLSGAVVVPVVGPKLFSVEAIAYASYWF